MSVRVATFGEVMLRLTPRDKLRFLQEQLFEATFGGGEANVAVALAGFGVDASFITVLPQNEISDACIAELRKFGVDTTFIVRGAGRLGVYYVETGANQRPSKVIYDREHSAIATAQPSDVDFHGALANRTWLHVTGITPAISQNGADLTRAAVSVARQLGITVSCDLNYRKRLWRYGKRPSDVMRGLVESVDVLFANEEDIEMSLDFDSGQRVEDGTLDPYAYQKLAERVFERFPHLRLLATTLRESKSADYNEWSACVFDGKDFLVSSKYSITDIVDRVGGGDSFAAGLIYGLDAYRTIREALEFAVAASALNHSTKGDFSRISVSEAEVLMNGDASGRVRR